MIHHNKFKVIW